MVTRLTEVSWNEVNTFQFILTVLFNILTYFIVAVYKFISKETVIKYTCMYVYFFLESGHFINEIFPNFSNIWKHRERAVLMEMKNTLTYSRGLKIHIY